MISWLSSLRSLLLAARERLIWSINKSMPKVWLHCGCRAIESPDAYPSSVLSSASAVPYWEFRRGSSAYRSRRYGFLLQIGGSRKGDDFEKLGTLAPRGRTKNCSCTQQARTKERRGTESFLPRRYKPSTVNLTPTINLATIITAKIVKKTISATLTKSGE